MTGFYKPTLLAKESKGFKPFKNLNLFMKVVGLDLAGKPENQTGFCVLTEEGTETKILHYDDEIIREIENAKPDLIAVDAPFWVPQTGMFRLSEEKLLKRGFNPISTRIPTMEILAIRASKLVKVLRGKNFKVIEVFAGASERILGLSKEPRKNDDEYEALLCALTGKYYLEGKYEDVDGIIIPK
jgi:predicted nuclease with RNAse H fold